jgi:hypothetical protein
MQASAAEVNTVAAATRAVAVARMVRVTVRLQWLSDVCHWADHARTRSLALFPLKQGSNISGA